MIPKRLVVVALIVLVLLSIAPLGQAWECTGCTRTPGYWKNHDFAYQNDTFYSSGMTYKEVLWTPPATGNAYFILARAYIAAKVNKDLGVCVPSEIHTAGSAAQALFNTYDPEDIAGLPGGDALRQQFLYWATILDNYNNGYIGPGKCD
ncbi:MAG: hypothetical protein ACYC4R_03715 [Anaerolineae bacterium]